MAQVHTQPSCGIPQDQRPVLAMCELKYSYSACTFGFMLVYLTACRSGVDILRGQISRPDCRLHVPEGLVIPSSYGCWPRHRMDLCLARSTALFLSLCHQPQERERETDGKQGPTSRIHGKRGAHWDGSIRQGRSKIRKREAADSMTACSLASTLRRLHGHQQPRMIAHVYALGLAFQGTTDRRPNQAATGLGTKTGLVLWRRLIQPTLC